jgi:hypothetical protein
MNQIVHFSKSLFILVLLLGITACGGSEVTGDLPAAATDTAVEAIPYLRTGRPSTHHCQWGRGYYGGC